MRRTLLITGASGGIGAATARMAAARGYDLALTYRADRTGAEATAQAALEAACKTADEATAQAGTKVRIFQTDQSDPADIARLFEDLDAAFPRLDALVNNAGIVDVAARVEDMSPDRLTRMFHTNTIGPMLIAGHAVRRMAHRHGGKGGVIVNVSSAAARIGSPGEYVDYAASKAAIDTFTRGLALENATDGIRVTGVRPGIIDTDIHARGGQPARVARIAPLVPMQRAGTADEVAEAILWLLSDAASYVTGSMLDVSGGR